MDGAAEIPSSPAPPEVVANGEVNGASPAPVKQPTLEEAAAAQMKQLDLEGNKLPTPVSSKTNGSAGAASNGVRESASRANSSSRPTTRSSSTNNAASRTSSTTRSFSSATKEKIQNHSGMLFMHYK